jgi:hypothetical protein
MLLSTLASFSKRKEMISTEDEEAPHAEIPKESGVV